jgi:hypothetical protein
MLAAFHHVCRRYRVYSFVTSLPKRRKTLIAYIFGITRENIFKIEKKKIDW